MPLTADQLNALNSEVFGIADTVIPRMLEDDRSKIPDQLIYRWLDPLVVDADLNGRVVVICRSIDVVFPAFGSLPTDFAVGFFVIAEGGATPLFDGQTGAWPQGCSGVVRAALPGGWGNNFAMVVNQNSEGQAQYVLRGLPPPPA